MDIAGAAKELALLKGAIVQLKDEDKQICNLVAVVCEALCELIPGIREGLSDRMSDQLEPFEEWDPRANTSRTLRYGLEKIVRQLRVDE